MNVSELKNLFILHPGGTGGNHLANLISLIPEFESRLEHFDGEYQQSFLKAYERFVDPLFLPILPTQIHSMKAHFLDKHGLNGLDDESYRQKLLLNKRINILTGHWHCFNDEDLSEFTDHAWITMSFPKEDSMAYKRIKIYNFLPQLIESYAQPYDFKRPPMSKENTFEFDTDIFFEDNGAEYLHQFLRQHFSIELPDVADEMHRKWMYGLKKSLELFPNK
jgi:hypothetical protein